MPTESIDTPETLDLPLTQSPAQVSENTPLASQTADENTPDDTPEYPLSAPLKPDDPERLTAQSKAETAGVAEEELSAHPADLSRAKPSFKLALGSAVLIALSLGFELGRHVSQRR